MARNITGDTILLGASAHGVWSICYLGSCTVQQNLRFFSQRTKS